MIVMFSCFYFILGSIVADNITKTENKYVCKKERCIASYKHKTQLQRHKHNKCKGVSPKKHPASCRMAVISVLSVGRLTHTE